ARYQPRGPFLSVNAKQLAQPAFQVGPNRCKSDHGYFQWGVQIAECRMETQAVSSPSIRHFAFLILHLKRSQGVISSARRSAKAEVRGANPRESASFSNEE